MVVDVLDRVLDRQHVAVTLLVDGVDDRGERCRLTRPGGTGHQNEALLQLHELTHDLRKPEVVEGRDLARDHPQRERHGPALQEDVATHASKPLPVEGEVQLVDVRSERLAAGALEDCVEHRLRVLGRQRPEDV